MNILILLLASFGLQHMIRNTDGPFDIFSILRNKLALSKYFGVFFYKLFECVACSGFWSGIIVYLIFEPHFKVNYCFLTGLASSATCVILEALLNRLYRD